MTHWVLADAAVNDLDRLADFLLETLPDAAAATGEVILSAPEMLRTHPEIGRPVDHGFRELVISRGRTGYVALYEYDVGNDTVVVLRIRHQRELGYRAD